MTSSVCVKRYDELNQSLHYDESERRAHVTPYDTFFTFILKSLITLVLENFPPPVTSQGQVRDFPAWITATIGYS